MAERERLEAEEPSGVNDPFTGLHELAQRAETHAYPLPAGRVRQLGARRRHRRHIAAGTLAALAVCASGGVLLSQNGLLPDRTADPARTPSISTTAPNPRPARSVGTANLLQIGDVPVDGAQAVEITPSGRGRSIAQSSVCLPSEGLDALGATSIVTRNFRYSTAESTEPSIYTQALQFGSAVEAARGMATYRDWLSDCDATLADNGWTRLGERPSGTGEDGHAWIDYVDASDVVSGYADVPTYRGDADPPDQGWFESVGLTRVDDRVMITVYLVRGQDFNVVNDPDGDSDLGLPAHPQFALLRAAAERLGQ